MINIKILALSLIYWFGESTFFGWSLVPSSGDKLICDGIAMIIMAMSLLSQEAK